MNLDGNTSLALMQASQNQITDVAKNAVSKSGIQNGVQAKRELSPEQMEKFDTAAKDFEAMFVTEMMKPMFEQLKPNEMFGGGKGEEIFSGMMLQEYGKMMAETSQLGIADSVKSELIRMQSEADNGPTR